jgi:hypothetical protein
MATRSVFTYAIWYLQCIMCIHNILTCYFSILSKIVCITPTWTIQTGLRSRCINIPLTGVSTLLPNHLPWRWNR